MHKEIHTWSDVNSRILAGFQLDGMNSFRWTESQTSSALLIPEFLIRFTAFQCLGGGWQNHSNSWSQHIPYSPAFFKVVDGRLSFPPSRLASVLKASCIKGTFWGMSWSSLWKNSLYKSWRLETEGVQRHQIHQLHMKSVGIQKLYLHTKYTIFRTHRWTTRTNREHSPSSACSAPSQSFTNSVGPLGQLSRLTQAQATVEAAFVARCSAGADWGPCCSPGCGARWYRPDVQPLILFYFCYIVAGKLLSFAFATRWAGFQNEVRGFSALPRAAWQGQLAELKWGVGDGSRPRYPC